VRDDGGENELEEAKKTGFPSHLHVNVNLDLGDSDRYDMSRNNV
jgi:hypothetical protein